MPKRPKNKRKRSVAADDAVLSKTARAYAKKVGASRRLSIKFLKEAGIIERPGKLSRHYR